ncbi:hypothetical protein L3Q82_005622 [Scortum barcoo]|uniref:Uncharacterized protein n=1 Tax=Scortum barcoo TaxID=214431 RepID=A0ACB8V6L3_9TELE|nr:hypothetical protein L3Q82_005622 [Scortum barcoo]
MWRGIKCITDYNTRDAQCPRDPFSTRRSQQLSFDARFDDPNTSPAPDSPPHQEKSPSGVTAAELRRTLQRINPRKAAGPDNISGRALKGCAYQLNETLVQKLTTLGLSSPCVTGFLDFLTDRPQSVRIHDASSSSISLSTGSPQGCVLSPLLFTLLIRRTTPQRYIRLCLIVKFADDTAVVGRIANNDESCPTTGRRWNTWRVGAGKTNLCINVKKTKEMIVDFRRGRHLPSPLYIGGYNAVEVVSSFRYLGVHISDDLTWSKNTSCLIRKAHQSLLEARRRQEAGGMGSSVLTSFYLLPTDVWWRASCPASSCGTAAARRQRRSSADAEWW